MSGRKNPRVFCRKLVILFHLLASFIGQRIFMYPPINRHPACQFHNKRERQRSICHYKIELLNNHIA